MKYSIIAIVTLFISCNTNPTIEEQLTGIWINPFDDNTKIEFTEDSCFIRYSLQFLEESTFLEEDESGNLQEYKYGRLKYRIDSTKSDSLFYSLIGSLNDRIFSNGIFILNDNQLTEITYKTLPGITNHIDEIEIYQKENTKSPQIDNVQKVFIPQNFIGSIYIAYNQEDGEEVIKDSFGNNILVIPPTGILKTKMKDDPVKLANQEFEFYEVDSNMKIIKKLETFQHGDLGRINRMIQSDTGNITLNVNTDDLGLFIYGFNQRGRESLESEFFKEKIEGNVLCMEIDTIWERLRIDYYSEKMDN